MSVYADLEEAAMMRSSTSTGVLAVAARRARLDAKRPCRLVWYWRIPRLAIAVLSLTFSNAPRWTRGSGWIVVDQDPDIRRRLTYVQVVIFLCGAGRHLLRV